MIQIEFITAAAAALVLLVSVAVGYSKSYKQIYDEEFISKKHL